MKDLNAIQTNELLKKVIKDTCNSFGCKEMDLLGYSLSLECHGYSLFLWGWVRLCPKNKPKAVQLTFDIDFDSDSSLYESLRRSLKQSFYEQFLKES